MKLSDVTKIMRGSSQVSKIYLGTVQVYTSGTVADSTLLDYTFPLLTANGATEQNESAIVELANVVDATTIMESATRILLPMASKVGTLYSARLSNSTIENWIYTSPSAHHGYNEFGEYVTRAINEPRFNFIDGVPHGFLLEMGATNLFLNSSSPATQTITVTTGGIPYCIWVEGSGSVTVSGGITGTATAGSPVIAQSTTTSITCTVSGTLTHVQVEKSGGKTSKIITAGASATRGTSEMRTLDSSAVTAGLWTATNGSVGVWIDDLVMFGQTTTWFQLSQTVNSTTSNGIRLRSNNGTNDVDIVILRGGTTVVAQVNVPSFNLTAGGTFMLTWSGAAVTSLTVTLYCNGVSVWTQSGLNMPTMVQAKFNNNTGLIQTGLKGMMTWNTALTSTEALTWHNAMITVEPGSVVVDPPTLNYGGPYTYEEDAAITAITPTYTGAGVTFSVSPALPTGLTLNTSTGAISGTPTTPQSQTTYTITATNSGGSAQDTIQITITTMAAPTIEYGGPYSYPEDSAITAITPTATGSAVTYSVSPALPTGLTLNTSTGVISGTPTTPTAQATYTVTATNGGGSVQDTVQITITEVAAPTYHSFWGYPTRTQNPTNATDDNSAITVGLAFQVKAAGKIHAICWHKPSAYSDTGPFTVGLYTQAGTLLGSKSAGTISGNGWQTVFFDTPISVSANGWYVAAVYNPGGSYSNTNSFFNAISPQNPSYLTTSGYEERTYLLAPPTTNSNVTPGNGRYKYATGMVYPDETWQAEYYWTDVLFVLD